MAGRDPRVALTLVSNPVHFVLFDLGGVLVRLGGVAKLQEMAQLSSTEEVWHRWLTCRWVRDFERGRCTAEDFAAGVVSDWGLAADAADFLAQFRAWPEGLYDGAAELVASVRRSVPVGCLSNSNALHWTDQSRWLAHLFDAVFLSHELGLIKPDREVFDHVSSTLGVDPPAVVFLDDNELNVTAARAAGFAAHIVSGVDEARAALTRLGLLAS